MPLLHVTTFQPLTSALYTLPNDGKMHSIRLNLGLAEEHSLVVQLGDHTPQHLAAPASVSAPSATTATAGHKRPRLSGFLARQGGRYEPLSLTIRYTAPTTRQDQKATRSVQQYHARTIRQIETAMRNAKQARLELEAAPGTLKPDLVAAALEIHLLTKELNRRRGIEVLYYEQTTTNEWFVVQADEPSRLLGVPGSPLVCLLEGDGRIDVTSLKEVVIKQQQVPVVPLRTDRIEGEFVKEIALDKKPKYLAYHAGRAYVTYGDNKISVLDAQRGAVVEEWTTPGGGLLNGVTVHGGHVFVADAVDECIRVLDMEGKQQRQFNTNPTDNLNFDFPSGMAIADELLYVCDKGHHRVNVFKLDGTLVRSWGSRGAEEGAFICPSGVTVHEDEVFVVDTTRVQVFGLDGSFRRMWESTGRGDGEDRSPFDIIVHEKRVYVTNKSNRVQVFKPNGTFLLSWGTGGSAAGALKIPMGLCVDDKDRLWVCDSGNRRIQVFR